MAYHHGWLWIVEKNGRANELFNNARTAAYLGNSDAIGCGRVSNVLGDAGCEAYRWHPCPVPEEGDPFVFTYTDPVTDQAPWYNPAHRESEDAIGFWVEDWTGLDSGHIGRTVTPLGAYRGGGQLGPTTSSHREMAFQVILLGSTERSLQYLFDWLDATVSSVCSNCATDTILLRRFCPDIDNLEDPLDGIMEMREVGLLQGLQWGEPPVEYAGCFIRRATFVMAAQDPCLYAPKVFADPDQFALLGPCFTDLNIRLDRSDCRPACSELGPDCRTVFPFSVDPVGGAGPVVTITSRAEAPEQMLPVRVRLYADPYGVGGANPCGLPLLAELNVASLPESSQLIYDMVGRQILYVGVDTGGPIGGFQFVEPNTVGIPRYATVACGDYVLVVEPNQLCLSGPVNNVYEDAQGNEYNVSTAFPDIEVEVQERMGCA